VKRETEPDLMEDLSRSYTNTPANRVLNPVKPDTSINRCSRLPLLHPGRETILRLALFFIAVISVCSVTETRASFKYELQNMAPVALCRNIVVSLDPAGTVSITASQVDGGSYDPDGTIVNRQVTPNTFTCSDLGTNSVVLTVTDDGGLTSTCTAIVTVIDNIVPLMACRNITVYLDETGSVTINPADIDNGSTDNCPGTLTLYLSRTILNCSDIGTPVPVTLTGTDASGNSASCTAQVTVLDTISPVVNLKAFNLVLGPDGSGVLLPSDVDNGSFDNCGPVSLSVTPDVFSCGEQGTQNIVVTATDPSGNSSTGNIDITVSSTLEITATSLNNCDVAIPFALFEADVTGGDGNYTYFWDGLEDDVNPFLISIISFPPYLITSNTSDQETPFFNNTMPDGIYHIRLTVTDGNGCADTSDMVINHSGPIFNNVTMFYSEACEGGTEVYSVNYDTGAVYSWSVENGTILTSDPDTSKIEIQWNTGVPLGVVRATITKPNPLGSSCTFEIVDTVTVNSVPSPLFNAPETNVCSNSLATYTLTDTYTAYHWIVTGGQIIDGGSVADNYVTVRWGAGPAGRVMVTVDNSLLCPGSVFVDVVINALSGSVTSITDITCNGIADGMVTVAATAGSGQPPYEYSLDGGAYQPGGTFTNISLGNHTVRIRDAQLCTYDVDFTITQPQVMLGAIESVSDVSCFGGNDGSLTVSVTGGTPPYEYSINGDPFQGSGTFTGLTAGVYTVIIRDANNCLENVEALIAQPFAPLAGSAMAGNVLCFGDETGSVDLTVTGGTPPYTFLWSDGAVTGDLTDVPAGTYTVTITDANGCIATAGATVTQPSAPLEAVTAVTDVLCHGDATGAINLTVTGGTPPYTFLWSNGAITEDLVNLAAGTYTVTITDANGCELIAGATVTEPSDPLSGTVSVTNVNCFGGSDGAVDLTVTGGTSPYTFLWSNGAITEDISGLTAGNYAVVITDQNWCTFSVSVTVTEPVAPLAATAMSADVPCHGEAAGTVDLTVTGGTPPYTFLWSNSATTEDLTNVPAGTYSVTITDANGCTTTATDVVGEPAEALSGSVTSLIDVTTHGGSDGSVTVAGSGGTLPYEYSINAGAWQSSGTFGSLTAGSYIVTIRDNNLCTFDIPVTITQPPPPLSGSITTRTNVSCNGGSDGSVTVEGSDGYPPYEYSLDGGPWQGSGTFSSLTAGDYEVSVRDASSDLFNIAVTITEPDELIVTVTGADIICRGDASGSATANVNGGTEPYSYLWSTVPAQTGATATALTAGDYTVTVTDANGCSATASVTIAEPSTGVEIIVTGVNITCNGGTDGSASVTASGGAEPYTWSWNTSPVQTTPAATGLTAGNYTVTVTDNNGCVASGSVQITEPAPLVVQSVVNDATCPDEANGSIILSISGGTQPWSAIWSNGINTQNRISLLPGTYSVVVTDSNGCSQLHTTEVGFIGTFNCMVIPTIITPNNDGFNDEWIIRNIDMYPDAEVLIFNRWGRLVFRTKNISANPWDGTFEGRLVATDSYHYILYLNDGSEPRTGIISVIR